MTKRNQLLHPLFIICLLTLILNDFYLKSFYSNDITGKLSDFAGLIVFPVFVNFLFPKTKKWISLATGILFLIWKTPIVSPLIDTLNEFTFFNIQRTIDYSDYWALLFLPIAHSILNQDKKVKVNPAKILQISKISVASISFFAICATTIAPPVELPKGTVYIGKEYIIKKAKEETINAIKSLGYNVDYHENSEDSTATKNIFPAKNLITKQTTLLSMTTMLNQSIPSLMSNTPCLRYRQTRRKSR